MCKECKHFFKLKDDELGGWQGFCNCPLPKWLRTEVVMLDITDDKFMDEQCDRFESNRVERFYLNAE